MNRHIEVERRWAPLLVGLVAAAGTAGRSASAAIVPPRAPSSAVVVLAGGCYWGVESVFRHVRGITSVTSGYASPVPAAGTASRGPAEAVRIVYDPSRISYRQILDVFFSVVHDPTQLDRQGPDVGPEYRSIVFVDGAAQRRVVRTYIDSLSAAHVFPKPIVTRIAALQSFKRVDDSQQRYAERHPTDPYIVTYDVPKVKALRQRFPRLYRDGLSAGEHAARASHGSVREQ
ncbi:MAG TPA: peptide-methionine (S)-S-oxide reductase MsrA [Gemmatimonadaceae bacterium]|nr:peptide-methionine (S)-S-oxide reductase MsrA [Gemmatimonadaceae bacterium]